MKYVDTEDEMGIIQAYERPMAELRRLRQEDHEFRASLG